MFMDMLRADLSKELKTRDTPLVCRLNVVSDIPWEREYPELFHELTTFIRGLHQRHIAMLDGTLPENYHLTFSRSERNEADCRAFWHAAVT